MTPQFIKTLQEYKSDYESAKALGAAMLACNAMIVPKIAPHIALLFKTFPRPISTNNDSADVEYAGGLKAHVSGTPKMDFEGSFTVIETETGQIAEFAELLQAHGGGTDCIVYDGHMNRWTKAYELLDCAMTFEPGEIDSSSTSQILSISGNMRYMYFGLSAELGSKANSSYGGKRVNMTGMSNANNSGGNLLTQAQNILNVVQAGNNVFNAAKSIFG